MARKRAENREGSLGFPGTRIGIRRTNHQPIDRAGSLLPPVYGEAWAKGHATGTPDSTFPGIGGPGCKTAAALEDVEGSSSAWVDEDDMEITGVDINLFCLGRDESGWSKFNGWHFIFVMFSSVWVGIVYY
ncbi:hypothetical protein TNCV_53551 [Trichonephila clavipes]|nr:hypothetical protein TNCV_53551 [Trichonephila clavipes]